MSKINLTFRNKKYSIDKSLLAEAVSTLENTLSSLGSTDLGYYIEDNESGGQTLYITDPNSVLTLIDNEFGGQTAIIN